MKEYVYYLWDLDELIISNNDYGRVDFVHVVPCIADYFGHYLSWMREINVTPLGEL